MDVIVLDPPYMHCGHYINNHRYGAALTDRNAQSEKSWSCIATA